MKNAVQKGAQLPVKPLFPLGRLHATPGALEALAEAKTAWSDYVQRHVTGDWTAMAPEDMAENWRALLHGDRIFSAYRLSTGQKLWVITEADRSATTLLLPEEY